MLGTTRPEGVAIAIPILWEPIIFKSNYDQTSHQKKEGMGKHDSEVIDKYI